MNTVKLVRRQMAPLGLVVLLARSGVAVAAQNPAAAQPAGSGQVARPASADDTPSIKIGVTLFADYTLTTSPTTVDADGNTVHANDFKVTRSYINITGNLSRRVAFRITPDVV